MPAPGHQPGSIFAAQLVLVAAPLYVINPTYTLARRRKLFDARL